MSNQSGVQAAVRALTGTALTYEGDWHALFDLDTIDAGPFEARMLNWINLKLSSAHTSLPAAQQAFAEDQGFNNWSSMNTFTV